MKTADLLPFCRYYKGEEECPYSGNEAMLWLYEMDWTNETIRIYKDEKKAEQSVLNSHLSEYIAVGLSDFSTGDNIPITLKALLFDRYSRDVYSKFDAIESFKIFYAKYYNNEAVM
jgi:hypothetical protein